MTLPADNASLIDVLIEARSEFFRTYGDSANSVIIDPDVLTACGCVTEDGPDGPLLSGLRLVVAKIPGHPVCLALLHDPLVECERCRGL